MRALPGVHLTHGNSRSAVIGACNILVECAARSCVLVHFRTRRFGEQTAQKVVTPLVGDLVVVSARVVPSVQFRVGHGGDQLVGDLVGYHVSEPGVVLPVGTKADLIGLLKRAASVLACAAGFRHGTDRAVVSGGPW